uniref:hypothetical protein n=1 Tax=Burkholderia sp. M701 TaxID=326454 RepID=UPI0012EBACA4|nr:hypothetical protein [Burkholderia sp. M701]
MMFAITSRQTNLTLIKANIMNQKALDAAAQTTDSRRVHLVRLNSDIVEDHFEQGLGASTGCGYQNEPIGRTFPSLKAAVAFLSSHYGYSADHVDYEVEEDSQIVTARAVANHSEAQNGGWMDPTDEENEAWRAGKTKLYSEEVTVEFHYL